MKFVKKALFPELEMNNLSTPSTRNKMFNEFQILSNSITYDMLVSNSDSTLNSESKSFVRVRSKVHFRGGQLTYSNVPTTKDRLMLKVMKLCSHPKNGRMFSLRPAPPVE